MVTNVREYAGPGAAAALCAGGWRLLAHDRRFIDPAARSAFEASHPGSVALAEQDPSALAETALERAGAIEALVSNDVVEPVRKTVEHSTAAELRGCLETGLVWPFVLAGALVPGMRTLGGGAMVFVTSGTAAVPKAGLATYCAARAGATALALTLAKELGPDNIQVNAVGPNWFKSETYFPDSRLADDPSIEASLANNVPIGRLGTQEEMGALVAFLVSRTAMPMTGQMITFAGGFYP